MQLHLVDLNPLLTAQWEIAFRDLPDVVVRHADILKVAHGAIVSPANSHGHMDGGIDREYIAVLGARVQSLVYAAVDRRPEGRIPVGSAEVIATGHARIPYLVVAPTMEVPEQVSPVNCYRAMRAALRAIERRGDELTDVFCPGLATGVGCVPESEAAAMMAAAYRDWRGAR